jgi:hypothetical protein
MTTRHTWVVITTINPPTEAIKAMARLARERGWDVVVVGDTSTPDDWTCPGVHYLSVEGQSVRFGELARLIPLRHYSRKNLGYLYAIQEGAECIFETDDDNFPYDSLGRSLELDAKGEVLGGAPWVNVYAHFSPSLIWPRGLPLDAIHVHGTKSSSIGSASCPVQQYLCDGDPDVDAIWRLLYKQPVRFDRDRGPLIVDRGSYAPFNSQNTVFFRDAFPLLYLPCHVSFRMTDIWRSLVAQRVLWAGDARVCFHAPTMEQVRNKHDLMRDFQEEMDGYLRNREIAARLDSLPLEGIRGPAARAAACWDALGHSGVLPKSEKPILHAWLDACSNKVRT